MTTDLEQKLDHEIRRQLGPLHAERLAPSLLTGILNTVLDHIFDHYDPASTDCHRDVFIFLTSEPEWSRRIHLEAAKHTPRSTP